MALGASGHSDLPPLCHQPVKRRSQPSGSYAIAKSVRGTTPKIPAPPQLRSSQNARSNLHWAALSTSSLPLTPQDIFHTMERSSETSFEGPSRYKWWLAQRENTFDLLLPCCMLFELQPSLSVAGFAWKGFRASRIPPGGTLRPFVWWLYSSGINLQPYVVAWYSHLLLHRPLSHSVQVKHSIQRRSQASPASLLDTQLTATSSSAPSSGVWKDLNIWKITTNQSVSNKVPPKWMRIQGDNHLKTKQTAETKYKIWTQSYRTLFRSIREPHSTYDGPDWGHEKRHFSRKCVLFHPKFCKRSDDPTPWATPSFDCCILSKYPEIVVVFCKYSTVLLNLVWGDNLLVTVPTTLMIPHQVCSRIRRFFRKSPRKMLGNRPEVLRKMLLKVVWKIVRKTMCSGKSSGKLSGNLPEIVKNISGKILPEKSQAWSQTGRSDKQRVFLLGLQMPDTSGLLTGNKRKKKNNTEKKQDYRLRALLSMVMSSRVRVCEGGLEPSSWQLAPCLQAKLHFSHLRCCSARVAGTLAKSEPKSSSKMQWSADRETKTHIY